MNVFKNELHVILGKVNIQIINLIFEYRLIKVH
jgi:hypothetical protein